MNRTILTVAGVLSASSLLLVDSAVKGTALLVLAASAALILKRDSAATRHLVWMLTMVALLVVPVLSALFAYASVNHVTGSDFAHAFILGFEAESRVANAVYQQLNP